MENYNTVQKNAKRSGLFFLTAIVFGITSAASWGPVQDGVNDLYALSDNQMTTLFSMSMLTLMAISTAMIAIPMFPVLRKYDETMALASVAFRIIESVFYLIKVVLVLGLLALSNHLVESGQTAELNYDILSSTLYSLSDATGHFASLFFNIGALIYCLIFFKTKLIPRWISALGLATVALGLIDVAMLFFHIYGGDFNSISIALNLPTLLFELSIATWLIIKGYDEEVLGNMEIAPIT